MRWDEGQKKLAGEILAAALKLERNAWSTIAHLDRTSRQERLPGFTSIFLVPDAGIPGVVDEVGVSIITDAIREGFSNLESLEVLVETFAITASPTVGDHARILVDSLWSNYGHLEAFAEFDEAADSVEVSRASRDSSRTRFVIAWAYQGKSRQTVDPEANRRDLPA